MGKYADTETQNGKTIYRSGNERGVVKANYEIVEKWRKMSEVE